MVVSAVVRCRKYWNGELELRIGNRVRRLMVICGARVSIAVESHDPRNLHKLRKLRREQTPSPPAIRPLKVMKDQVSVEMHPAIQSGGEIVVAMIDGMILNQAETHRPNPRLHPRRRRRLRMPLHLRALLSDLSVRCQPASFGPACLTVLRNE